ncbi:hypothetical protein [Paenibacillus pini]|uniref:Uncharacterized protein n=1 Tax=Paenibacillus pini JCM 16418 TaxID=1236976 RepID=W7YJM3_9BACL|nr:hypothetical protein [Paenibacillus pini]GAF08707.1 hypothetical protein JCM16418_2797 [Paenibacillus pini JCM 16418]
MLFWIIASFIVIPFVMAFVSALSIIFRTIIHALALLSIYVSGSIVLPPFTELEVMTQN